MSERFDISPTERGVVRLFTLDLPPEQAAGFTEPDFDSDAPAPIDAALGVSYLDTDFVEVFPVSNLDGLGLAGYLVQGLGVPEAEVAADRARLNALTGHVVVVLSQAFGGHAATLTPKAPLTWIGTYTEEGASVKFAPLPSESAKGVITDAPQKPPKSNARISGMVAMYALLALFALVVLMIWVAG